jgi:hypothetical protein
MFKRIGAVELSLVEHRIFEHFAGLLDFAETYESVAKG